MTFTVTAADSVYDALALIYVEASDRKSVRNAADWIEMQLKNDPLSKVTPIDDLYFLRRCPLVALCKISVDDRLVTIIEIHRIDVP